MNENNRIVYTQAFAIDIQRLRTNINKTTKIKPPLEVILDSGTAESIVDKLTGDAYNSLSHIIGIGGAQISRRRGSFGNLKHCIEVPLTPAILLAAGRILENERWHHFKIEKDPLDSTRQKWIGVQHDGKKIVIGIRDKSTGFLFRATDEAGHVQTRTKESNTSSTSKRRRTTRQRSNTYETKSFPATLQKRSSVDRAEDKTVTRVVQALAFQHIKTVEQLKDHFQDLKMNKDDIDLYAKQSREAQLLGVMTNPRYRKLSKAALKEKQLELQRLTFFESLTADSLELLHADHKGRKKGFLICDRKTGTPWILLYKTDSEIPDLLQQFLVDTADRWRIRLKRPDLRCSRIKMDGLTSQTSIEMKKMLAIMKVAFVPVPPQYHRASHFIESKIKRIRMIAQSLWNGLGYRIPKSLHACAYSMATIVLDLLPDSSHVDNLSPFELREHRKPMAEEIPRTLYSTVYYKNPDTDKKVGASGIGIFAGNGPVGTNASYVWDPRSNRIKLRYGCRFDERFSEYPTNRIARMRENHQVHSIHDKTHGQLTRADAKRQSQEKRTEARLTKDSGAKHPNLLYHVLTKGNQSIERAFACPICQKTYRGSGGIRNHATSLLKKGDAIDAEHAKWIAEASGKTPAAKAPAAHPPAAPALDVPTATNATVPLDTNKKSAKRKRKVKSMKQRKKSNRHTNPIQRLTVGCVMTDDIPTAVETKEAEIVTDQAPPGQNGKRTYHPITMNTYQNPDWNYVNQISELRDLDDKTIPLMEGYHAKVLGGVAESLPSSYHRNLWGSSDEPIYEGVAYYRDPFNPDFHLTDDDDTGSFHVNIDYGKDTPSGDMDLYSTPQEIQEKYDSIKYTPDPSPQFSPDAAFTTMRSILGAEDEEDSLFTNQKYQGPPGAEDDATEIHGYHASVVELQIDPETNAVILTEENCGRFISSLTLKEAMKSDYWKLGLEEAVNNELTVMNTYDVFSRSKLPFGRKLLNLKWVFKAKFENSVFVKFKARLCAVGLKSLLIPGIDYNPSECSSPVARSTTYMTSLSEAAKLGYEIKFFDIKSAYLLCELKENLYVRLPPGLNIGLNEVDGTDCLVLNKSLYGLPQSGYNHHTRFVTQLLNLGFHQSKVDPCLFLLDKHGEHLKLVLWVDDAMVTTSSEELWEYVRDEVAADSPLSKHGELEWILGMSVHAGISSSTGEKDGTIKINQTAKIQALLATHKMLGCNPKSTPLPTNWHSKELWVPDTAEQKKATVEAARSSGLSQCASYEHFVTSYRELLGSLSHLCSWGRFDLKQSVFLLARYQACPGVKHWLGLVHILKYLNGTKDLQLTIGSQKFISANGEEEILRAQVDSDYCGHKDNVKSTTGYVIFFYGACIFAESRKQRSTTLSTTEAELVAASDCTKMLKYIRRLLTEDFGLVLPPTPLGEDNQGCIHLAHDGGNWKRKRHIRVANSYLYEEVTIHKTVAIKYVPSSENCADMMTKCLPRVAFEKHRAILMGNVNI